jgi:hypothetical protein
MGITAIPYSDKNHYVFEWVQNEYTYNININAVAVVASLNFHIITRA